MFRVTPFNRSIVNRNKEGFSLSEFMNDFFADDFFTFSNEKYNDLRVDIKESDDQYTIFADAPGIKKEEIDLHYENNILTISINRDETLKDEKTDNYVHQERITRSMVRKLNLKNIIPEDVTAKLSDGVLTIKAPKDKTLLAGKRIEIK